MGAGSAANRSAGLASPSRLVLLGEAGPARAAIEEALRSSVGSSSLELHVASTLFDTGTFDRLAEADHVLVVTLRGGTLTPELRRSLLLCSRLCRTSPVLIVLHEPDTSGSAVTPAIAREFTEYAGRLGELQATCLQWPGDRQRLLSLLEPRTAAVEVASEMFRLWVEQADSDGGRSILEGRIVSGAVRQGDQVILMPSAQPATVAAISEQSGGATMRVTLDRLLDAAPGQLLAAASLRPELADQVAADVVWVGEAPLLPGRTYALRLGPQRVEAQISTLKHVVDPSDLDPIAARRMQAGDVGAVNLSFSAPLLFDPADACWPMGRFILEDPVTGRRAGIGNIHFTLRRATNIHWQALAVDKAARAHLKGQKPCCLWFTGLSGSGKSTVASLLEKRLNALGRHTYTLDGDNVRHGLNRNLGFTDADRVENIRRVAEVAKLFVDAGLIVMVSFISPFLAERRMARGLLAEGEFIEIFVDTPIEVCEARDVKGLYKKARAGQLKNFTGIDSPYEPPGHPEIRLAGGSAPAEVLVEEIMADLARRGVL
ncbi:MAG TPA: adenylyl-sulfate kinase [Hyphomicrobiaceae bacterium]|nr:adenylyl-sulfate kinase [Hyphomicrobiaceae bacterium]